jgi:hypothetical protein
MAQMHRADKAVLRLAVGAGLSVLIAYGLGMQLAFVAPALAIVLLCKPGPPMPLAKGVVAAFIIAALLAAGVAMVPLLEHYRFAGLLLTAALLYALFYTGARKANPLTIFLVMAVTAIPVAGVAEQALAMALAQAIALGIGIGALVSTFSHALFPDEPGAAAARPAGATPQAARRGALQATLIVMPVFVLALTNPVFYLMAIMKTVALSQQAGTVNARSAGQELVGSTLMGALMAVVVWFGLKLLPNLWMLVLWIVAAAFWGGARAFGVKPSAYAPSFWVNALMTMLILLGPGMEDAAVGKDVYAASAARVAVFICVALYAWAMVWLTEVRPAGGTASPEPLPPPASPPQPR